jgi:hypothetical protein
LQSTFGGKKMKYTRFSKIMGAGVVLLLIATTVGSIGVPQQNSNPQPLGILAYDPTSHDFGDMSESEINSTVFQIWKTGGCCEVTFTLECDSPWITVFPTSGVSNGEKINITVTVNTTGLEEGFYAGAVLITSDGGNGAFNVTVNVISHTTPWLAVYPNQHFFGVIPTNSTQTCDFQIWNSGTGTLHYTLSCPDGWVAFTPADGSSTGEHQTVTVTVDTKEMTQGATYQSSISITSNGGNKLFYIWFIIGTLPNLQIKSVSGGLYKVGAQIINTGTADAIGVDWSIGISGNGLVILGKQTSGRLVSVPMGSERTIDSSFVLGFGKVMVTVTVFDTQTKGTEIVKPAQLILFYIKM